MEIEVSETDHGELQRSVRSHMEEFEIESSDHHQFHSTNALEIMRETVRILRYNLGAFMITAAVLICPASAILLPNLFVDESLVKKLTTKLLLTAKSSGLPLMPFVKHSCQKLAETAVSSATHFPVFITLSLCSKIAVIYSVDCTYSRKKVDLSDLIASIQRLWKRLAFTYLWISMIIIGCLTLLFFLIITIGISFSLLGLSPDLSIYGAIIVAVMFSVIFANTIIICNTGIVVCVLEDNVSGLRALFRARDLIKGLMLVGLLLFIGSSLSLAFVEGLFEHRVKHLSYGDGSSRLWEGPLLVIMYSFVVLIDTMMSTVFYFCCRYYSTEASASETEPILETFF